MSYYLAWLTLMNYVSCLRDEDIITEETKECMHDNLLTLKSIVLDAEEKEEK